MRSPPRTPTSDAAEFEVTDIRVEGLQRISEGAVFNSLPVNIGDRIGTQRIREALRALNDTGFFRDVELRRDESALVVVVQERPTIRTFDLKGNKAIKTEDMSKSLRNVGLASGKILNRYMLEDMRQYLIDQYFARGHYDVRVDVKVEEQPGNLVDVHVDIDEGKVARIRQINVVGNERFSDKELLAGMELKAHNLLSFYRGDDRYSRQLLSGRSGEAALLLHGSRLCGFRNHFHAGGAGARERRPLHHGERFRGRHLENRRREARGPIRGARGNPAAIRRRQARGHVLAAATSR